jgi:hypothetical protein
LYAFETVVRDTPTAAATVASVGYRIRRRRTPSLCLTDSAMRPNRTGRQRPRAAALTSSLQDS